MKEMQLLRTKFRTSLTTRNYLLLTLHQQAIRFFQVRPTSIQVSCQICNALSLSQTAFLQFIRIHSVQSSWICFPSQFLVIFCLLCMFSLTQEFFKLSCPVSTQNRVLSRFGFLDAHSNQSETLSTDQKWILTCFYTYQFRDLSQITFTFRVR